MNQSLYDITEAIGMEISPVRELLSDEATANYLRNLTLVVLNHISNPALNVSIALSGVILTQGLPTDHPIVTRATVDVYNKLHRFLSHLPYERNSRLLTVVNVSISPVSYHLTLGHVA